MRIDSALLSILLILPSRGEDGCGTDSGDVETDAKNKELSANVVKMVFILLTICSAATKRHVTLRKKRSLATLPLTCPARVLLYL